MNRCRSCFWILWRNWEWWRRKSLTVWKEEVSRKWYSVGSWWREWRQKRVTWCWTSQGWRGRLKWTSQLSSSASCSPTSWLLSKAPSTLITVSSMSSKSMTLLPFLYRKNLKTYSRNKDWRIHWTPTVPIYKWWCVKGLTLSITVSPTCHCNC